MYAWFGQRVPAPYVCTDYDAGCDHPHANCCSLLPNTFHPSLNLRSSPAENQRLKQVRDEADGAVTQYGTTSVQSLGTLRMVFWGVSVPGDGCYECSPVREMGGTGNLVMCGLLQAGAPRAPSTSAPIAPSEGMVLEAHAVAAWCPGCLQGPCRLA